MRFPRSTFLQIVLMFSLPVLAQLPKPFMSDDDKSRIRGHLETQFQYVTDACKISPLKTARLDGNRIKDGVQISAVPVTLQKDIAQFDRPVVGYFDRSTAELFSLMFIETERKASKTSYPFFDPKRMLPTDYLQDPVTMLPKGSSALFYNHTCSSIVNAALSANLGIAFPIATLSSAIQDQYGNDKHTVVSLVEGHFSSPLNDYFGPGADFAHRNYGPLLVWEWYVTNPQQANQETFWLSTFDGLALYRSTVDKRRNNGQGTVDSRVSFPVVTATSALKASFDNATSLTVDKYFIFPYTADGGEWGHFERVPKASDIISMFAGIHTTQEPFNEVVKQTPPAPYIISQELEGVPPALCQPGPWKVRDLSANPNSLYDISVSNIKPDSTSGFAKCKFIISFGPKQDLFKISNPALVYAYVYSAIGLPELVIQAAQVNLDTSAAPDVHLIKYDRVGASRKGKDNAGNDVDTRTWKVTLQVNDKDDPVDSGASIDTSGGTNSGGAVRVTCPSYAPVFDLPTATYTGNNPRTVDITLLRSIASFDPEDVSGPLMDCDIVGTVGFTMAKPAGGIRVIYKTLPKLAIKYPALKAAQPAGGTPKPVDQPAVQPSPQPDKTPAPTPAQPNKPPDEQR